MSRTSRLLVVTTTVLTTLSTGIALAFWSSGGSGASSAGTGTGAELTLSPGTPVAGLYPGGSSAVHLVVVNPGPAQVRVGSLQLSATEGVGGFDVDAAHNGCSEDSLSFATQTNGGAGWTVAGDGSLSVTLPAALTMDAAALDDCQGAVFTVYLKAVG